MDKLWAASCTVFAVALLSPDAAAQVGGYLNFKRGVSQGSFKSEEILKSSADTNCVLKYGDLTTRKEQGKAELKDQGEDTLKLKFNATGINNIGADQSLVGMQIRFCEEWRLPQCGTGHNRWSQVHARVGEER